LENNLMTYLFTEDQEIKNEIGNPISISKNTTTNSSDNPIFVSLGSETITITGDVNVGTAVEITNDEGSPIPTHTHLYDESDNEYTDNNPFTIDGTVTALQGTDPWTVDGTVELGATTLSALENINATVSGTVSVDNFPETQTVDGNVGITGDVNVTQGTDPWVVSGNVNATIVGSSAPGVNKPFYLEVAQGLISGYTFDHRFGAVPSMGSGVTGSVWDINDTLYPWDALGNGSIVNVERNNAGDNGITVTVQGLDENYEFASEDIVITGADQTGSQLFTRVNRAFISGAITNAADIDIEAESAGGTTIARISAGYGQTQMALYTIPAGKTGYILHGTATGSSDTDAEGRMMVRYFGTSAFRIGHAFELQLRGGQYDYTFQTPIPVPEKTDIDMRATMRSNNKRITAAFDILLVDN
jgi:hypothetical protein